MLRNDQNKFGSISARAEGNARVPPASAAGEPTIGIHTFHKNNIIYIYIYVRKHVGIPVFV